MAKTLVSVIKPGDKVTIVTPQGQQRTGRAVMRSSHGGWVLNMGGKHGTPGIADDSNIVAVRVRGSFGAVTKRCEVFATAKPRAKRMEYAGSFESCSAAEDYAEYLRKGGHRARVKRR